MSAQTTWTNVGGTFAWNSAANWSLGVPLQPNGIAVFGGAGTGTVDLGATAYTIDQLNFNAGNYTLANGGLTVNAITNAAGTNVLSGRFVGSAAMTGNVSGGTLSLTNTATGGNANSLAAANTFTVGSGGTLTAAFGGSIAPAAGSYALGSAPVVLNGGTLRLAGDAAPGQGATTMHYNVGPLFQDNRDPYLNSYTQSKGRYNTMTPAALGAPNSGFSAAVGSLNSADAGGGIPAFAANGFGTNENYYTRSAAVLNITTGGTYTFGTRSDDGSNLYINGQRVVENNFYQGQTTRTGQITLAAGQYLLETDFYQGTGGAGIAVGYSGPDNGNPNLQAFVTNIYTDTSVHIPLTALTAVQARVNLGTNVSVTANSTLRTEAMETLLGTLTIASNTQLTATGFGVARFTSTTLAAGATPSYTFRTNELTDIAAGTLANLNAGTTTLVKSGSNNLIFDSTTAPTLGGGLSIQIDQGRLISVFDGTVNPIGGNTPIEFAGSGGTLQLRTRNVDQTLGHSITATAADGVIELASLNNDYRNMRLTGGVTLGNNRTLTYSPLSNITLGFDNPIVGTGNIAVTSGYLDLTANNSYTGNTRAFPGGTLVPLNNSAFGNAAGSVTVDSGGVVVFYGGITMNPAPPVTISGSGGNGRNYAFGNGSGGGNNSYGGTITLSANATISAESDTLTLTNTVAAGGNVLTVNGVGNTTITGSLTGTASGGLVKADGGTLTLSGNNTYAGPTTLISGTVRVTSPTGLGSSNVSIPGSGVLRFDAGTGNTAGGTGTSVNVPAGGRVETISGIGNLSAAVVTLGAGGSSPGLLEGYVIPSFNNDWLSIPNPGQNIVGQPSNVRMGQLNNVTGNPATGWSDNNTWIYTGQIRTGSSGILSFAEQIDDNTRVLVNNQQILLDFTWNNASSGTFTGLPNTYYDIEIRMYNGGGGAGPSGQGTGWSGTYGFGIADVNTNGSLNGNDYFKPGEGSDPLGTSRFRTGSDPSLIAAAAGATQQVGRIAGSGIGEVAGTSVNPGTLQLVNQASATANTLAVLRMPTASGAGIVNIGTNQTLTVPVVNVAAGGNLLKSGAGSLVVTGTSAGGNTGNLNVDAGDIRGTGTLGGGMTALAGGTIRPGSGLGTTLTAQGNVAFQGGSNLAVGLGPNAGGSASLLTVTGAGNTLNLSSGGASNLVLDGGFGFTGNAGGFASYIVGTAAGGILVNGATPSNPIAVFTVGSGNVGAVTIDPSAFSGSLVAGDFFTLSQSGNNLVLTFTPVPEPATVLALAAGVLALGAGIRRRRTGNA